MDEPIRLEEKYVAAAGSSHLRMNMERACDIDLMLAAGLVRESLATELYRLAGEFDRQKATIRQQDTRYNDLHAQANARRRKAGKHDEQAEALCEQAEAEALTARALVLLNMKTLNAVVRALRHFSEQAAARQGFGGDEHQVHRVAGHALDLLLDPLCPHCDGVGTLGGYGEVKSLCKKCGGSTRRRIDFGSIESQLFGTYLLAEMERKVARTDALMLKFLRQVQAGQPVKLDPTRTKKPNAELQRRLAELRSRQAQRD